MKKSALSLVLMISVAVSHGAAAQSVGSIQSSAIGQTVAPMSGLTSEISRAEAAESALATTANAALPAASAGPLATQPGASPAAAVTGALGYVPINQSGGDASYTTAIAQGAAMAASLQQRFAQRYNVALDFGAKGDAVQVSGCSIAAGSNALHCPAASFAAGDVGKALTVRGAGNNTGMPFATTISSVTSPNDVVLAAAVTTSAPLLYVVGATVVNPGTGIVPGQSLTISGGTGTAAVVTAASTQVVSATINAAGSGGTNGPCVLTGTTGGFATPGGTPFQINATISGGAITALGSLVTGGAYSTNPTSLSSEPVTGCGLTGATLSVIMGAQSISLPLRTAYLPAVPAGAYTVFPSSPASATGGVTLNLTQGQTGLVTYGTDNTARFQQALNAAAGKASLWVPPNGTYLSGPLTVNSGTDLQIDGTLMEKGGTVGSLITLANGASNISIHGYGTVDGNWLDTYAQHGSLSLLNQCIWSGNGGASGGAAVHNVSVTQLLVQNCVNSPVALSGTALFMGDNLRMTNSFNAPGFTGDVTSNFVADNIYVTGINTDVGFSIYNGPSDGVVANSTFTYNQDGISFYNDGDAYPTSDSVVVANNVVSYNRIHGMIVGQGDNTRTVLHTNIVFANNEVYANAQGGAGYPYLISNCGHCLINGGEVHDNNLWSIRGSQGIALSPNSIGTIVRGVAIYNNGLPGSNTSGIGDATEPGVQISGNSIFDDRASPGMTAGITGAAGVRTQIVGNTIGSLSGGAAPITLAADTFVEQYDPLTSNLTIRLPTGGTIPNLSVGAIAAASSAVSGDSSVGGKQTVSGVLTASSGVVATPPASVSITTGGSSTLVSNALNVFYSSGTTAAYTLVFPNSPPQGTTETFVFNQNVTSLTLSAAQGIYGTINSTNANLVHKYEYVGGSWWPAY